MNTIRTVRNQFRGINPHLHSYWQGAHKWNRFHNYHVGQLMAALKTQLVPMGYTAELEESVQIRRLNDDTSRLPKAHILIRDQNPYPASGAAPYIAEAIALEDLLDDEDLEHPYSAVALYALEGDGEPVAWLELLSPSNKGATRDADLYTAKRYLLMQQHVVFIELDYLHETPPTLPRLRDYSAGETGAHPYRIAVLDPRPAYAEGRAWLREWHVDSPLPTMTIPLNGSDVLEFDFDAVYQKTFQDALYGNDMTYSELPMNFERYLEADQARIVNRMIAVIEAVQAGVDVGSENIEPAEYTLEAAFQYLRLA
jgi:hypothetical protein